MFGFLFRRKNSEKGIATPKIKPKDGATTETPFSESALLAPLLLDSASNSVSSSSDSSYATLSLSIDAEAFKFHGSNPQIIATAASSSNNFPKTEFEIGFMDDAEIGDHCDKNQTDHFVRQCVDIGVECKILNE